MSRATEEEDEEVDTNLSPSTRQTIPCCEVSLVNDHVSHIPFLARFRLFDDEPVAWV